MSAGHYTPHMSSSISIETCFMACLLPKVEIPPLPPSLPPPPLRWKWAWLVEFLGEPRVGESNVLGQEHRVLRVKFMNMIILSRSIMLLGKDITLGSILHGQTISIRWMATEI
jgi:hypothetical protein